MKNLWKNLAPIQEQINSAEILILLLDFDGTLAPIVKNPKNVTLPERTRKLLDRLNQKKQFRLGVISGRTLGNIKSLISLSLPVYAGSHGIEGQINSENFFFQLDKNISSVLNRARKDLNVLTKDFEGAFVEDKKTAISFHYRNVKADSQTKLIYNFKRTISPFIKSGQLVLLSGKKVFELKPNIDWDKGKFAEMAIKKLTPSEGKPVTIFIGDDVTDEDAFKSLGSSITIRVGKKIGSFAEYYLNNTDDVFKFLNWLDQTNNTSN